MRYINIRVYGNNNALPRDNFDRDQKIRGTANEIARWRAFLFACERTGFATEHRIEFKNIRVQREIKVRMNIEIDN